MSQDKPVSADQRMPWVKIPDLENKLKESVINPIKTPVSDKRKEAERAREWYVKKLNSLPPNYDPSYWMNVVDLLTAFASQEVSQAVAAERSECEKEALNHKWSRSDWTEDSLKKWNEACIEIAAAIHSRTEKGETK